MFLMFREMKIVAKSILSEQLLEQIIHFSGTYATNHENQRYNFLGREVQVLRTHDTC